MNLHEHPAARTELQSAAVWYESQNLGLGDKFLDAIDAAIRNILDWPQSAPVVPGSTHDSPVRSMQVKLFPYRVLYGLTDSSVIILAYSHHKRRPDYWQARFND